MRLTTGRWFGELMSLELKAAQAMRVTLPAVSKLGDHTSHPLTVDTFQSCRGPKLEHRPVLCHLSQAAQTGIHPSLVWSPFGDSLFATLGITHCGSSPRNQETLARRLRKPQHHSSWGSSVGFSTVSSSESPFADTQGTNTVSSRHPHPQCDVYPLRRPIPRAQYVELSSELVQSPSQSLDVVAHRLSSPAKGQIRPMNK